jgi:hypothetical protein
MGGKVIYDKRHGTRGDNQEAQFTEGVKNGVSRDRYDDRKTGFDSRDLQDQNRYHSEDYGKKNYNLFKNIKKYYPLKASNMDMQTISEEVAKIDLKLKDVHILICTEITTLRE